jgi:hypothetical protein
MRQLSMDRPILITGTPRSGKSVVAELIRLTEEFTVRVEPTPTWNTGRRVREHDRRLAEDASASVRRRIRSECEAALALSGGQRYADELAHHALRIPFVSAVLPEAKIIHVIRNPEPTIAEMNFWWAHGQKNPSCVRDGIRDRIRQVRPLELPPLAYRFVKNQIWRSLRGRPAAWGPMPPGLAQYARTHRPAEIAGYQWARLMEYALQDLAKLPDERVLEVRYERLVEQPEREVLRMAEFCEVRDPARMMAEGCRRLDPNHGSYAAIEPSEDEWESIWKLIAPVASRCDYTRDPLHTPRTVFPAPTP